MRGLKKIFKLLIGVIFIPPLAYMILVLVGGVIPVNKNGGSKDPDLKIYLVSNGMHTDIVVPIRTPMEDWNKTVKPGHTLSKSDGYKYVGFGWGDLGFYASTPRWEDLTPETGFKALFLKTPAAMHVTFHHTLIVDEDTKVLFITTEEYSRLSRYIKDTFEPDPETGQNQPIAGLHYTRDDVFYKARGSLNLFNTCNTWVNNGLKEAGLKACLWTPFVEGIFYRYP